MARHESPNHDSPATAQHHSTKPPLPPSGDKPNEKRQTVRVAKPTKKPHGAQPARAGEDREAPASASQRTPLDGGSNEEVEQKEETTTFPY